jgi:Mg2+-importing ATPase
MENAPHIPKNMLSIPPVTTLGNSAAKLPVNTIHFSPILAELARLEKTEVYTRMKTSAEGLSEADAEKRLAEAGPNVIASEKRRGWLWRLLTATRNPLVILLIVLAIISFATGDAHAGTVMSLMVILGVSLRFVQEARVDAAAAKLKAMITLTTAVVRAGKAEEIPLEKLTPGDVVTLCAGDMIPADVRIISRGEIRFARDAARP